MVCINLQVEELHSWPYSKNKNKLLKTTFLSFQNLTSFMRTLVKSVYRLNFQKPKKKKSEIVTKRDSKRINSQI